jgi:hypothetical protein
VEPTGVAQSCGGGCESTIYNASWNDQVSSFKVTPGCTLTLWQHINQRGGRFGSSQSYRYVGGGWNDELPQAADRGPGTRGEPRAEGPRDREHQLASVATDVLGVSARAMLKALTAGDQAPEDVAELAQRPQRSR